MTSTSQLNIKRPEARRLAVRLSELTGENVSDAVTEALRERVERLEKLQARTSVAARLMAIAQEFSELPVLDNREPDDMLYDEDGLPR